MFVGQMSRVLKKILFALTILPMLVNAQDEIGGIVNDQEQENDNIVSNKARQIVAINPLAFICGNLHLSFEYIIRSGLVGFKVPLSYDILQGEQRIFMDHYYQTGIDVNVYPARQGLLKYFVGPAIRVGKIGALRTSFIDDVEQILPRPSQITVMVNNGIIYNSPTSNFTLSSGLGLGMRAYSGYDFVRTLPNGKKQDWVINFECSLGYLF